MPSTAKKTYLTVSKGGCISDKYIFTSYPQFEKTLSSLSDTIKNNFYIYDTVEQYLITTNNNVICAITPPVLSEPVLFTGHTIIYAPANAKCSVQPRAEFLQRVYRLKPETEIQGNCQVSLFFTEDEIKNLISRTIPFMPSTITEALQVLGVTKYASKSVPCSENANLNAVGLPQINNGALLNSDNGYYLTVNVASFSDFYIHPVSQEGSILPVELISFTAYCKKDGIQLQWTMATETNNDYFTLEKSQNVLDWNEIATISGAGNTNRITNYAFFDAKGLDENITYYRLKQTDFNGYFTYLDPISIQCNGLDNAIFNIEIYPNPTSYELNILNAPSKIDKIEVIDVWGRIVLSQEHLQTPTVKVNDLANGSYFIKIYSAGQSVTKKFIKQ